MISQEKINKIKKSIEKNCFNCAYLSGGQYYYEEWYSEPYSCSKIGNENKCDLKSFPHSRTQKCFSVDSMLIDGLDEDLTVLAEKFWLHSDKEALEQLTILRNERYSDIM